MAKKIFVSFKYDEANWQDNLRQLFQANGGQLPATPVTLHDVPKGIQPNASIEARITELIKDCSGLIALIGDRSQQSGWIDFEIREARRMGKSAIGVKHPRAGGNPPEALRDLLMLRWNSQELADWVASLKS